MPTESSSSLAERRGIDIHVRSGPQMRQYEAFADRIARDRPGRLLDWGCGLGQVTRLLVDRGVETTPFEFREGLAESITEPLERYPDLVAHYSGDPVRLPFENGEFDAVLSCGVLEHVPDPDGSLDEIARVLRARGTFYVFKLPNRWSYLERVAKLAGLYYHGALPHDRVYTLDAAKELLRRHGFDIREARHADMLPLTVGGGLVSRATPLIWHANRLLERVPALNLAATTLELVAERR